MLPKFFHTTLPPNTYRAKHLKILCHLRIYKAVEITPFDAIYASPSSICLPASILLIAWFSVSMHRGTGSVAASRTSSTAHCRDRARTQTAARKQAQNIGSQLRGTCSAMRRETKTDEDIHSSHFWSLCQKLAEFTSFWSVCQRFAYNMLKQGCSASKRWEQRCFLVPNISMPLSRS